MVLVPAMSNSAPGGTAKLRWIFSPAPSRREPRALGRVAHRKGTPRAAHRLRKRPRRGSEQACGFLFGRETPFGR
jgi:hypothetical protein